MQTLEAILTRKSCRKFQDRPVEDALVEQVVQAGLYAATGGGKQPWKIVVVKNPEVMAKLEAMNAAVLDNEGAKPFYGAPMVIVVLTERERTTAIEDGSLVLGNMMLEAHELGLGSCWIHRAYEEFETTEGKELLAEWGIEGDYRGVGHLIMGSPSGQLHPDVPRRENTVVWVR